MRNEKKVTLGLSIVRLVLNFLGSFYFSLLRADVGQQACSTHHTRLRTILLEKKYANSKYSVVFSFLEWSSKL